MRHLFYVFLFMWSTVFIEIQAQTCCSGGVPVSNAMGLPVVEFKGLQLNISYDYHNLNSLMQDAERLEDNTRQRVTSTTLLQVGTFVKSFSLEFMLPFIQQKRLISSAFGSDEVISGGVGDMALIVGRQLKDFHLSLGVKAPTGSIQQTFDGIRLNADMQNGSGSWDGLGLLRYSKNIKASTVYIQGFHIQRSSRKAYQFGQDYRFGNETQVTAGYAKQMLLASKLIDTGFGLRWRLVGANFSNEQQVPSSGGNWFLATANVRYWLKPGNTSLAVMADLPLAAKVDGLQNVPTFRINCSLYHKLNFKNE